MKVYIHNISNYYSSYYLHGFNKAADLEFTCSKEFEAYNNRGFLIFEINGKLGVVDNHDPMGVDEKLLDKVDFYFATNKVKGHEAYERENVFPLFPHYPVNVHKDYFSVYKQKPFIKIPPIALLKELYAQNLRTNYKEEVLNYSFSNYVFFSGSIWKKEKWANELRAAFIEACKQNPSIEFEGGFVRRKDGAHGAYDHLLNNRAYSPSDFAKRSKKSMIIFNNPAVLGAVSWRLAESLNFGSFVLSFPFKIYLPVMPRHEEETHYIHDSGELPDVINFIARNEAYHKKIAFGGKQYFEKYCKPETQVSYLIDVLSGNTSPLQSSQ
ncbi:hypothetical protein A33Q_3018 [Indibacter alkaliphilus LW1]|uniref:Glycosyltransferase family 1 protein n=1 Tax=Indibacter alkaliphilus (strain CCUG 57479 / KCTC 22604 / LW1) TaxID=1189612 RepID=S2DUA9_INDAL|nr:hypothetical protein [Indibacter alkaliphilus]EOZ95656.1 hypothetical protein A33Q_3018 [Indibacter alkaliphilus LW1]